MKKKIEKHVEWENVTKEMMYNSEDMIIQLSPLRNLSDTLEELSVVQKAYAAINVQKKDAKVKGQLLSLVARKNQLKKDLSPLIDKYVASIHKPAEEEKKEPADKVIDGKIQLPFDPWGMI